MEYHSVLLRCPADLYLWFEAQLQPGATVEEVMLLALLLWTQRFPGVQQAQLVEALSMPTLPPPPVPVAGQLAPKPPRRHTGGRRHERQRSSHRKERAHAQH